MAKFSIPFDEDGNVPSLFGKAWREHPVPVNEGEDIIHPCRAIAIGAAKFETAFNAAVEKLIESDRYDREVEGPRSELIEAFQNLTYKATEMFDVFATLIPKSINLKPSPEFKHLAKSYDEVIKSRRDPWAFICNKIKHNGNIIFPTRHTLVKTNQCVRGYILFKPTAPSGITPNKTHHKGEDSKPFEIAMQQVLYDVMKCDFAASEILRKLPKASDAMHDARVPVYRVTDAARKLNRRPAFAGDGQKKMFDGFAIHSHQIGFQRQQAIAFKGRQEIVNYFTVDEYSNLLDMSSMGS